MLKVASVFFLLAIASPLTGCGGEPEACSQKSGGQCGDDEQPDAGTGADAGPDGGPDAGADTCAIAYGCSVEATTQCLGAVIQSCAQGADGTLDWVDITDCGGTGERCEETALETVCVAPATFSDSLASTGTLVPASSENRDQFGFRLAMSGDVLAIGANGEDGAVGGINGDQQDNGAENSGAVYVYRQSGQGWMQEAYVKASNPGGYPFSPHQQADRFGTSIALDGDTLVIGAIGEDSSAIGVNGEQDNNDSADSGAVYVYRRSGGTWVQEAYLKASNPDRHDLFGSSVAIFGDTLVIGATGESSNARGINGAEADNSSLASGAVYVFRRCGSVWEQEAYLKASNGDAEDLFGTSVAISGHTLVVGAYAEASRSAGVQADPSDNSLSNAGAVYVFERDPSAWSQVAYVKPSDTSSGQFFGVEVAIEGDTFVAAASGEVSGAGAVYIFGRSGNTWSQEARLTASNGRPSDHFGGSIALSSEYLAVGAQRESSDAQGVDGTEGTGSIDSSGAAYLFEKRLGEWQQVHHMKAEEPQTDAALGSSIALSGTDVIVGAAAESSAPVDEPASRTGAVHTFQ